MELGLVTQVVPLNLGYRIWFPWGNFSPCPRVELCPGLLFSGVKADTGATAVSCLFKIVASNFFLKRNMYLAVPGCSCGMWDLVP